MIAVDTSALMAVLLGEEQGETCIAALETNERLLISAGTIAEALIVADRRNVRQEMQQMLDRLGFEVEPVTPVVARQVADAYAAWGKGIHPAGLNFGDCFSYALARHHDCPLLYVGEDFAQTDVRRV